jgi:hypothetical protein
MRGEVEEGRTDRVVGQLSDVDQIRLVVVHAVKGPRCAALGIGVDGEANFAVGGGIRRHVPVGCSPILRSVQYRHMIRGVGGHKRSSRW